MAKRIYGNIDSINKPTLEILSGLYDYSVARSEIISEELVNTMCELTNKLDKEVALYISRQGKVEMVSVGSSNLAKIPEIWQRRSAEGLSGLRCIHTHPNGSWQLSEADYSAMINLHLDMICAIGVTEPPVCQMAMLYPEEGVFTQKVTCSDLLSLKELLALQPLNLIMDIEKELTSSGFETQESAERAVLAMVLGNDILPWEEEEILSELKALSETAGLSVVGDISQRKDRPDAAHFLGKGKLEELAMLCQNSQANCVVFEKALSPSQLNNLNGLLGMKVLDKTTLILDIFAQRARSKEGKLQVELAQLNYLLPRLIGKGVEMSRLGGGVGTRGPGETKLESDRRHIRRKIQLVERELDEVKRHRDVQQKNKLRQNAPLIALVGYTNAGKSSLLNRLTDDHIYAADQLFATLDTTTRSLMLPNNQQALLTDTVGFIRDLPHQLINAFKATLDELQYADLLLHVIDISNPHYENQVKVVHQVLEQLGVLDKDMIYVFNKTDLVQEITPNNLGLDRGDCCYVSAQVGLGIDELLEHIGKKVNQQMRTVSIQLPMKEGKLLNKAYGVGKVADLNYTETHMVFNLTADQQMINNYFAQYIIMES